MHPSSGFMILRVKRSLGLRWSSLALFYHTSRHAPGLCRLGIPAAMAEPMRPSTRAGCYQIQLVAGVRSLSAARHLGFQLHVPLIKQTAGTQQCVSRPWGPTASAPLKRRPHLAPDWIRVLNSPPTCTS